MNITKFGLSNFRIFKKNFDFELAPITVLTGPNNSGKSSLTKALLLIKENQARINDEVRSTNFLDYSGGQHSLGDHKLVINTSDENTCFSFEFFQDYKIKLEIDNEGLIVNDYEINNNHNELIISQSSGVTKINVINFIKYLKDQLNFIQTNFYPTSKKNSGSKFGEFKIVSHGYRYMAKPENVEALIQNFEEFSKRYNFIDINLHDAIDLSEEDIIRKNTEAEKTSKVFKYVLDLVESDRFVLDEDSIDLYIGSNLIYIFNAIANVRLSEADIYYLLPPTQNEFIDFNGLLYIHTIKEPLKRIYTGDNLVIQSLIQKNLSKANYENISEIRIDARANNSEEGTNSLNEKYIKFSTKWLENFGIANELVFGYDKEYHIYFIKIDNKSLLENGLGISQLVYLLLAIGTYDDSFREVSSNLVEFPRTIIIEEPETGLHPDFQSKIAEMIVEARNFFHVNFIIETHSEYFIRKLQLLTAQEKLSTSDSIIYYFNNPDQIDDREDQIKEIRINEFGGLSDSFGPGFIDEGISLKFELLRFNQGQQN